MNEPRVIYEDKNVIALNKSAGLLVHSVRHFLVKQGVREEPTVAGWLLKNYPEVRNVGDDPTVRPGIVHRLDKETSGVLLVARTQSYFEYLKSLFKNHEVRKTYLAVVRGYLAKKSGTINIPIGFRDRGGIKRSLRGERGKKEAVTDYRVLGSIKTREETYSLLEVCPETGRTHQIRAHLAGIGHPILGDRLYGGGRERGGRSRLMLHALSLEFSLARGKRIKIEAEPPREFAEYLSSSFSG